jgi:hypothetical protein
VESAFAAILFLRALDMIISLIDPSQGDVFARL